MAFANECMAEFPDVLDGAISEWGHFQGAYQVMSLLGALTNLFQTAFHKPLVEVAPYSDTPKSALLLAPLRSGNGGLHLDWESKDN
jgi:hypothetical protein